MARLVTVAAAAAIVATMAPAVAQEYPSKVVRIVTSEAGAGSDFVARLAAHGLTAAFGQQFIVDNRAGGVIAGDAVARSAPDGHTLLVYGNTLWLLPLMRKQMPYDPQRDFAPVTLAARGLFVLVVHPSLPVKSVKELIALARARPGELNFSTAAPGTTNHLASELFKSMASVNMVRVSYRGATSALNALMSGDVQVMFPGVASVKPHMESGRIRVLAVATAARSPQYPDLPTVAESGVPGFEAISATGFFVPARTPDAIVVRLNQEIVRVLRRSDVQQRMASMGLEPVGSTPAQLAAMIKEEVMRMGRVIREAGIQER
ncbi:MAG TPA: tripartite tricarboxylate transporter substrate binding protein [Burkholderiales bacterium]|jgi:tripartite-type tricarboxylate transporter receptor subunit TctC|nr:tripartite tricarboxylate transporter substrate binding protein [Burkholderiales bacterium]